MKRLLPIIALVVSLIPGMLCAQGWVILDEDGSLTKIDGDWIRIDDVEEGSFSSIFNLSDRTLIIISQEQDTYSKGTLDDYCKAIKAMTDNMMEGMTPEQREMMEAFMDESADEPPPSVEVRKTGEKEVIAGYGTEKYEVMVDGELYEEVWISNDAALKDLIDTFGKVEPLSTEMVNCSAFGVNIQNDPEFSEPYRELIRKGMEMKTIRHEYGTPQPGTTVVSLDKRSIPASEFSPPDGYRKIDFQEFLDSLSEME